MAMEAMDERPSSSPGAGRENGGTEMEARSTTGDGISAFELARLKERIAELEEQHSRLRWDSLLVAGVTTIAVGLIVSMMLQRPSESQPGMQPIVKPRTISAQSFLLTDSQGHARARLTVE